MQIQKNNTFDVKKFNDEFEKNDVINLKKSKINKSLKTDVEKIILPHQQSIEYIIINIRDFIFLLIDMIENQKNPIPFILASDSRIFICSLFLIIFGSLLLLLSSLMKSPIESF